MNPIHVIKRDSFLSLWFMFLLGLLWAKMFNDKPLLQEPTYLILSILVAVFFLTAPTLYLTEKIIVNQDSFVYQTLFSKKMIHYKEIRSISFRVSKQHDMDDDNVQQFHSATITLQDGTEMKIPFAFFAGKDRGTVLIRQAVTANPEIKLDDTMSQMKDGEPIPSLTASRIIMFIFSNVAILFVFTIIP